MEKIAFIAPFEGILAMGQKAIEELGLEDKVKCYLGMHAYGVEIAQQAVNSGADVIVSRGGTAGLIAKSGIQIPVVEIPITVQDLAEALVKAKKLTGLDNPKIAVIAYKNMIYSVEVFTKVMDIQLIIYEVDTEEEIPRMVERAIQEKLDVLIGGKITTTLATDLGVKTVLLASGTDSFRMAFQQAEKLSYVRRLEKERMQKFRVLVDYSTQGIISIDSEKCIEVFNSAAERLLGYSAIEVTGKDIETVCSSLPVDSCLKEAKDLRGELLKINNKKIIANIIPIIIGEVVTGAMITIEDVGQIVEMEATIRKSNYSKGLTAQYQLSDIRGLSPQIIETKRIAQEYASIDATVLILGGSGTGKELFAQGIHNASKRKQRPFVAVNCGAISSSLLESELFGYVEGAFTGANKKGKAGFFELAHGGTIFLDEIAEMDKIAQTSLLRVIQERRVMRLGDDKYIPIDVRIIAATNKNLFQLVKEGTFREDLYYRLNVERLVLITKDRDISAELLETMLGVSVEQSMSPVITTEEDTSEKTKILRVLKETGNNQQEAAKRLGIDRSTLYRKLKALKIEVKKVCNT